MEDIKRNNVKDWLWGILLIGIAVPMLQHGFHFANEKSLKGSQEKTDGLVLTKKNWFNGDFQKNTNVRLTENFGFRSSFVRLHNQLRYSLFERVFVNGVVVGKDNYLFEAIYINAYYGDDFVGADSISDQVNKLKFLQDTLEKQGKELLVVFAPGKARFMPESIPESRRRSRGTTNYDTYLDFLSEKKVNFIDFQEWFVEMKKESQYPLYSKGGIHWSRYGEILATDSIRNWIEKQTGQLLPAFVMDELSLNDEPMYRDNDIGEAMNLMIEGPEETLAYPSFHIEHPERNLIPVSFIADSYYWGIHSSYLTKELFGDGQFWYYNKEIHKSDAAEMKVVSEVDVQKEIESSQVVVIMATEPNLRNLGFGFIDQLYSAYTEKK